jgi:hypothetical protein
MGNSSSASQTLPQIWERINARYLRHRLTQEIIEEHPLLLPPHCQQPVAAALRRRIALHHPAIAKVIYYRIDDAPSLCHLESSQQVLIYTEYTGDSLERVAEEKGERRFHSPCQCTHILSAAEYLQEHYGFFAVTPSMVFLGNRREKNTRVWINSQVELSERELSANEEEMCESLCKLLAYMRSNRLCAVLTDDQLENAQRIRKLSQLKTLVFDSHRTMEENYRHRKSNSAAIFSQEKQ